MVLDVATRKIDQIPSLESKEGARSVSSNYFHVLKNNLKIIFLNKNLQTIPYFSYQELYCQIIQLLASPPTSFLAQ